MTHDYAGTPVTPSTALYSLERGAGPSPIDARNLGDLGPGFATRAPANGAGERAIKDQGRWRSLQVARTYIRHGSVFTDNAAGRLGL